jgi:hypothetical protein
MSIEKSYSRVSEAVPFLSHSIRMRPSAVNRTDEHEGTKRTTRSRRHIPSRPPVAGRGVEIGEAARGDRGADALHQVLVIIKVDLA